MTDIFSSETASPAPAPVESQAPAAPAAPARTPFDDELDAFMERDLLAEMTGTSEPEPAPAPSAPAAQPAVSGSAATGSAGAPTPTPQPAPANGGTPPATTTQQPADGAASPQVDPNLLMEMFGGAAPAAPAAASPASPAAPAAPASAPAPTEDAPFQPFTSQMKLPAELVRTFFESEDRGQQEAALTGMFAALGNATIGLLEKRLTEHHAPQFFQQIEAARAVQTQAEQVNRDFYGAHPELVNHQATVIKAGQVYMAKNPGAQYDETARNAIAGLAKAALQQMGVALTAAPPAAAPAATSPAAPAVVAPRATPYVAGGASPGGPLDNPGGGNDPGSIFEQMTGGFA